jgi:cytochrome c-type biogenesis protein
MPSVSFTAAFIAGLLSFLSPCVLPLIPGYISLISGLSVADLKQSNSPTIIINALFFTLGFSIIFIILGASATALGQLFLNQLRLLNKIAGIFIIVFGLQLLGVFNIGLLNREKRVHLRTITSPWMALVAGCAFAFGWSPCIGPLLAAILAMAGNQDTVFKGIALLSSYSLGLAIPFILTALAINQFLAFFNAVKRYMGIIERFSGVLLIILGMLIYTNNLIQVAYTLWKK